MPSQGVSVAEAFDIALEAIGRTVYKYELPQSGDAI